MVVFMFPHAEEVNAEKWLENPVYLLVRFLKLPGEHMTPYSQTCSGSRKLCRSSEDEGRRRGRSGERRSWPSETAAMWRSTRAQSADTVNIKRSAALFFLFWLYWIKSATLRGSISPSAQIKALGHQRSGTECWLYDYDYMQINWNSPPPWTLFSTSRPSLLLLNELIFDSGWCFAFIQKEVLLLSDSNKDKTCPGDPLLILLISGWLDPHQYQGAAVALHSCTSQQKAIWTRQQLTRLKERRASTAPNSIQMSHTFSILLINIIQLQHVLRNLDINSILMFKVCLNCAPISIQRVPN